MAERLAGLLPAAGEGQRLGQGPKAFVEVAGRTLLAWSLLALARQADELVVALPEGTLDRARQLLAPLPLPAGSSLRLIEGRSSRQATVAALLDATEADWVVVHDAARPFLDARTLGRVVAAARESGAASAGMPVTDTLVRVQDDEPVDRAALRAVQTPQAFRRELLRSAHAAAASAGWLATDDAGLVRRLGLSVAWVEGGPHLLKVTHPQDLALAEAMVAAGLAPDPWLPAAGPRA